MKKVIMNALFFGAVCFPVIPGSAFSVEANQQAFSNRSEDYTFQQKKEIIGIDQRESTDIFAIPLDESDFDDRQQINRDNKTNTYSLPIPPGQKSNR